MYIFAILVETLKAWKVNDFLPRIAGNLISLGEFIANVWGGI